MKIRLDLDPALAEALVKAADRELRHPQQQAEAILRVALGVPVPPDSSGDRDFVTAEIASHE